MHRGYIKKYRRILDHWLMDNAEYYRAWDIILFNVNHTKEKVLIGSDLMDCDRGEKLYSVNTWVGKFGKWWTYEKCRKFFKLLEKDNMITLQGTNKTTRLKVIYYDKYNIIEQTKNKQKTIKKQSKNNNISNEEELLSNEEEKNNNTFDEIWKMYNRKGNKKTAKERWDKISNKEKELCLVHIPKYVKSTPNIQYRKNFEVYINKECWNDEIIEFSKPNNNTKQLKRFEYDEGDENAVL